MARTTAPAAPRGRHPFQDVRARLRKVSCMKMLGEDDHHLEASSSSSTATPTSSSASITQLDLSREHMETTTDQQEPSALFSKLPLEVRRMIYTEVWRSHLGPNLKMHVHAAANGARLTNTPCVCDGEANTGPEEDPLTNDPWQAWSTGVKQPPVWFWHAWGLRMRWGRHWMCQKQVMLQWKPDGEGACRDERNRSSYLGVFLTCKRMYAEAVESLFESTTLVFSASEDAYRFFIQQPHPYQSKIHALDFSFTHHKDHLFLKRLDSKHPQLACCLTVPVTWEVWTPLMSCVRERLPELHSLKVHLATQSSGREEKFLPTLKKWEEEGHGKVEDDADGTVYVVRGRHVS